MNGLRSWLWIAGAAALLAGCATGPESSGARPTIVEEERRAQEADAVNPKDGGAAMGQAQDRAAREAREIQSQRLDEIYEEEKIRAGGKPEDPSQR